ncbi:MAG TPA: bacillithiol biosynthesis cysteine-adding enzyme BshC [Terriglobales bacterium]|nr:bacillithiol biosynthesis cysteine-adding enzyme BshC [Terriglobales bacterium]
MSAQCVPFRQIPHSTKLFLDYLSYTPPVRNFYPRSPLFPEWLKDEASRISYDKQRREQVSEILARQNQTWGSSAPTLVNIERLRAGAVAAVTGQQVGLFGGPMFSIFKAFTAVKLASEATAAGVNCVPIFWLATEDHDLAEINHVSLIGAGGDPQRVSVETRGVTDAPVGTIKFGPEVERTVQEASSLLGDSDVVSWLRESYRQGETLGSAFARLFARLFADWGVILLDPADKEFHTIARPLFRNAVERAPELDEALLARGKEIEAAGYHQQVKVTAATTLLFEVKNGVRTAMRRKGNGNGVEFVSGEEKLSRQQLLDRIDASPENFNPNVLFRPVVQDYLLPTLVYTGGAAEVAYFAQLGVVYEKLLGRVTPVLPRFSATLVEPKAERVLSRYKLTLPDVLQGPEKVREAIAVQSLPPDLKSRFDDAHSAVENVMTGLRDAVGKLDSSLIGAAERARSSMSYRVKRLQGQVARAEAERNEVITRHADTVSNALFPNKSLQEREIGGVSFVARYGTALLNTLYESIHTDCHDHQLISVQ